jgi:hypothetical protein
MDAIMSPRYKVGAAPRLNQSALDRLIAETESLNPGMGSIINDPFSIPFDGEINEEALQARAPRTPQAQAPTAAPIYTPPPSRIETPQMGVRPSFDFSNLGNFNLR